MVLQHRAERRLDHGRLELAAAECLERLRPVDRLGDSRRLHEVEAPQPLDECGRLRREPCRHARHLQPDDLHLALERGMVDPVVERPALERVVQLARAVRRQHDHRPALAANRADLRNGDLEVRQHLEQERLELVVGAVDLVDQQHDRLGALDRLEQRAADQELRPEQLLLGYGALLCGTDVQQLARVVPLVDGVRDVEALVALQADQATAGRGRERLRGLRLSHARLAFEQQRLLEGEREEQRRREPALGKVGRMAKRDLELIDRRERHRPHDIRRHVAPRARAMTESARIRPGAAR